MAAEDRWYRPGPRSVFFVGNATVIIRWDDIVVMTDPNFLHRGQWAYLGKGLVSRRRLDPALDVGELPRLDAIVLSHLHGDHFDRVARRGLDQSVPIITTTHAAPRLHRYGFAESVGLDVWEEHIVVRGRTWMRVVSTPGRHGPRIVHRLLPPVMGGVLEFGTAGGGADMRIYVTGDTLMYDGIREIPRRHPGIDLALIHLGGTTLPGGILVTMDGRQGAELLDAVRPERAAPIHYNDYGLFKSPLGDFFDEVAGSGLSDRIRPLRRGQELPLQ